MTSNKINKLFLKFVYNMISFVWERKTTMEYACVCVQIWSYPTDLLWVAAWEKELNNWVMMREIFFSL